MSQHLERSRSRPPIVRRAAAGLVLLIVGVVVIDLAFHVLLTVAWIVAVVAVVAAVVWAIKTLF